MGQFGGFGDFGMGSSAFSFRDAEEIFKRAFGGKDPFESFFGDDDDFFNAGFGGFG
jgi:hypothetical protein